MFKYVIEVREDPKDQEGVREVDFEAQDDKEAEATAGVLAGSGDIVCLCRFDSETRRWVTLYSQYG